MSAKVLIKDVVDALQMQFEESLSFLNLDTGEVETVSKELLNEVHEFEEGDEDPEDDPKWDLAKQIAESDRFVPLPSAFDVNEWEIMRRFSNSVQKERIRGELLDAIHGTGAFRHFKSTIRRLEIERNWYDFRDNALREIAIDWCEERKIEWK